MRRLHKVTPRAVPAFLLCVFALLALAAPASAAGESYGELTRFGLGGPGETLGTLNDEHRTRLLGVDPTDNSAYVLDEPSEEEQAEKKVKRGQPGCPVEEEEPEPCEIGVGPITRHFRLQKFAASGGKYSAVASVPFVEQMPTPAQEKKPTGPELETASLFEEEIGRSRGPAVEGVAVDPALGRVYVLTADYRLPTLPIDDAAVQAPLLERKALLVASTLYAYSTHPTGASLAPAVGGNPVLTSATALGAQSAASGQAMLEPAGITVDPETHEVIVLGHVDEGGAAQDNLESGTDHFALQRIHSDGTLGARYVDRGNFFAKEATLELRPNSPIVVGPEKKEHVYVGYKRGLSPAGVVEIPANFESHEAPKPFFTPPAEAVVEEWVRAPVQPGAPNVPGPLVGGALSASPEGTIFSAAMIGLEEFGSYQAVVALSGTDGSVIGWTGGQAQNPEAKPEERYRCVIEPLFYNPTAPIAAGSGGDVFVLAPGYLYDRSLSSPHEIELYGPPAAPAVIELGPGGSGCPAAKSRGLAATLKGVPLEGRSVKEGEQVGFITRVNQADALKVEWDFGDGSKETVAVQKKPEEPQVKHAFTHSGTLTVTAVIHTDDLATPTITLTTHVTVEGNKVETEKERIEREERERKEREEKEKHETEKERKEREQRERKEREERERSGPKALGVAPARAYRGVPALFDGSASSDPGGPNQITAYRWVFGDGGEYSGAVPIVFHTYASLGSYVASLIVTDRQGRTSAPYRLLVRVVEPPAKAQLRGGSFGEGSSPIGGVASFTHGAAGVFPDVTMASASLRASPSGILVLLLYCPAGETSCAGTVTLRAVVAVAGGKSPRPRKTLVTLAKGGFSLAGGTRKQVALRLSRQALSLLRRLHSLHAQALIVAHDPAGATHTTNLTVTLRAAPAKHAKH
jgi:PKD repeat protein